jgi:signal peptidase I
VTLLKLRAYWDWIWPIAIGFLIALGIRNWVVDFANVPSSSMYPTIPNPCYILDNHLATRFEGLYRGEVVLFHFPDDPKRIFVKRIIGLPGETVTIHDNHVYINNKPLKEPYLTVPTTGTWGPYVVPKDSYFMLGDNRPISDDSRWWIHKFVPRSSIIGRADFVIWPLNKIGKIR